MGTDPEAFTNLFTQSPARFWPLTTPAPLINCWVHWERTQLLAHCQKAVVLLSVEAPGFSKQWGCRQPLPDVFSASKLSQAHSICCSQGSPAGSVSRSVQAVLHRDVTSPSPAASPSAAGTAGAPGIATKGSRGREGSTVLGIPGTVHSVPLGLLLAAYRIAIGIVPSQEECSQERNKWCCSGTGFPSSCWHPDLRPQQIIQPPVDTELTDLGQKGSELHLR